MKKVWFDGVRLSTQEQERLAKHVGEEPDSWANTGDTFIIRIGNDLMVLREDYTLEIEA